MTVLTTRTAGDTQEVIFGFAGRAEAGFMVFQKAGPEATVPVDHGNGDLKIVEIPESRQSRH